MTKKRTEYFPFGLILAEKAWNEFGLKDLLLPEKSKSVRPPIQILRLVAHRITTLRLKQGKEKGAIYAGQLSAMGLITDIFRYVVDHYCQEEYPGSMEEGLEWTREQSGETTVELPISRFVDFFPPSVVKRGLLSGAEYLDNPENAFPRRYAVPLEVILLDLTMRNPALKSMRCLFDDSDLKEHTHYEKLVKTLEEFFRNRPPLGLLGETLFAALRAPILASPDSLEGQIDYIARNWSALLPPHLRDRLLQIRDILREEQKLRQHVISASEVLSFDRNRLHGLLDYPEFERFSPDMDWMTNVVLLAKSTYVWLHQLSGIYQRPIERLDQIPDAELDRLARWGFTGLWLIGVWERSPASMRIKQQMGNPEALSSAYSLYDYQIAQDLGGEPAFDNLRNRARERGIRLASDMVPNHVGLYSKWVIEHPDWFIQLDYPPFPVYQFNGPNLSSDDRVGLYIEDGYWDHRDAAVVFKRVDHATGDTRYIYHGNDGTHMPWNDTAQLDYLKAEVREAVIQTILHVARQFPIIRFDAAMTLAKKHFQRLWYPCPGEGGDIPSRAERGMSREDFNRLFPEEFWREVVDRVAQEVPDTLLLAEAFWLMEGYFVRTLGMHRVYNSAFMNMLKMEDNAKYRTTVKNVLEFSPEILKRFVNFMNNPDEETAIAQFGKGDKYFGIAAILVTMPGLPMFGHGQIEGFTEKYGMEYRRSYHDEWIDEYLVRRHETEIFPLMRKRYLFAGIENFAFYDFVTPDGHVDENVFAYSNRCGNERAVVLYNNAYNTTRGRIHTSTRINIGSRDEEHFVQRTLTESLGIKSEEGHFYIVHDHRAGLEYLLRGRQLAEEGLYAELQGYQYHAFLGFTEVYDFEGSWERLAGRLGGKGTRSVVNCHREMELEPVLVPFHSFFNGEAILKLSHALLEKKEISPHLEEMASGLSLFLDATEGQGLPRVESEAVVDAIQRRLETLGHFEDKILRTGVSQGTLDYLSGGFASEDERTAFSRLSITWALIAPLTHHFQTVEREGSWLEEWLLIPRIEQALRESGSNEREAQKEAILVQKGAELPDLLERENAAPFFADSRIRDYLEVNLHEGTLWFVKERLESLLHWLFHVWTANQLAQPETTTEKVTERIAQVYQRVTTVLKAAEESGYRLEETLEILSTDQK